MSGIAQLAATPRLLVALDFDGTLSPLVPDAMSARMTPAARAAVESLAVAPETTVALVSGRSLHDLREIAEHDDDSPVLLAGSHGAEYWLPPRWRERAPEGFGAAEVDPAELALRDRLQLEAERLVADLPGAWIEPKSFGLGAHSRRAAAADADRIHERVDALMRDAAPHWRRREGHSITEYAFRSEGKDQAVAALRRLVDATAVLFAGDDVTDEDAIRALDADDLGVRVGAGESAAALRVADIDEFAEVLQRLADARAHGAADRAHTNAT